MKKKFIAAISVAALACTIPMQAHAGMLRLYEHNNFRGEIGSRSVAGFWDITSANNDKLSSWINDTNMNGTWHEHANARGKCHRMPAKSSSSGMAWWDNDTASSFGLNRDC